MNVALVYDRINKWGGAERVLLALHAIWPDAPLYTAVYDPIRAGWADVFRVHPSFVQTIPFAKSSHESLAWLTPLAFESFDFDGYDVVISVTSAEAKNIVTKPGTIHICYCLTPTRYLWSGFDQYQSQPGLGALSHIASLGLRFLGPMLRRWDLVASGRPDYYVAISNRVKKRIQTYYKRDVIDVIYPPVDTKKFHMASAVSKDYFLTVSRLVSYKRLDIMIRAFNTLKLPLIIIGDGRQKTELMRMAHPNIRFISAHLTDSELIRYYQECRAFVFAADEDFGLAAAEAQACGKAVIAYSQSGVSEIVRNGVTGVLFNRQTAAAMAAAIRTFISGRFDPSACRAQAENISESVFRTKMEALVARVRRIT